MSRQLPAHPNLEHLKNQAKDLLPDLQRRQPEAKLADALHAIACEYGFRTWPELKAHVASIPHQAAEPAAAAVAMGASTPASPFAGTWTADLAKSVRHPLNQFQ